VANKTKTFFEPTDNDIRTVTLVYEDGSIAAIESDFEVRSDDHNAQYRAASASRRTTAADYPPGILNAIAQLVNIALTKFKQGEGFE
jgi:hypothetical protein